MQEVQNGPRLHGCSLSPSCQIFHFCLFFLDNVLWQRCCFFLKEGRKCVFRFYFFLGGVGGAVLFCFPTGPENLYGVMSDSISHRRGSETEKKESPLNARGDRQVVTWNHRAYCAKPQCATLLFICVCYLS